MTDREIMQQALEALEKGVTAMRGLYGGWRCESALKLADGTITALRERLAQPVQEPVVRGAFVVKDGCVTFPMSINVQGMADGEYSIYTAPQPRQWLTEDEVMEIAFNFDVPSIVVRTVQAKLREKDGGGV